MQLRDLVGHFAEGISAADSKRPIALNARSKEPFLPGLGPHSEAATVQLVMSEIAVANAAYADFVTGVRYPEFPRQRCDLCIGSPQRWTWAIEVKLLRFLGDNGKPNDSIVMHILSPYPQHRSALTDCSKLAATSLAPKKAILIYGFESSEWPLEPVIAAFEVLARARVALGPREAAPFRGLVHPVHTEGTVYGWELG